MTLHLTDDGKLINSVYDLFEAHYPGQDIFIVQVARGKSDGYFKVSERERILFKPFTTPRSVRDILRTAAQYNVKQVLVHYLTPTKAALASKIAEKTGAELYWMFYGADLY